MPVPKAPARTRIGCTSRGRGCRDGFSRRWPTQRTRRNCPLARPGTTSLGLEEAHRNLKISPAEFDEVAAELGRTLDFFKVPKPEKGQVLGAFAAHKDEVTAGYTAAKRG